MGDFTAIDLLPFIAIGFAAQLIDGALGMAFGVISTTLLLSIGVPPAAASAGVHTAETFTTGASGLSHILHRNVDWRLFLKLAGPGVAGGVLGAYVLTQIDAASAKPFVLAYLGIIGIYLVWRGMRYAATAKAARAVQPIGLAGGFLDAAGGGGWGPIVTGNLLIQGTDPRRTIGTVNTVEFILTLCIAATFIATLGWQAFTVATLGLLLGGTIAAPLAARMACKANPKLLLTLVGTVLATTSLYGTYTAAGGQQLLAGLAPNATASPSSGHDAPR